MPDTAVPDTAVPEAERPRDALDFFGLSALADGRTWLLPVERTLCSGTGALFGGAAFGSALAVLEAVTGREVVWATAQFVHHVRPPAELQLEMTEVTRGRQASQARVVARLDGREMWSVVAAVGERDPSAASARWPERPDVPAPDVCPPRPLSARHRGGFMEHVQGRVARGWPEGGHAEDGRSAVWARLPALLPGTASLAVFGDYVPFGVRQAVGDGLMSHSLDNTLRVLRRPGPGWILADVAVQGMLGGFGHGEVHLWDEEGALLATASQSFISRRRAEDPADVRDV